MTAYRDEAQQLACSLHAEVPSIAKCRKCERTLCDACCAFLINRDPWCERCGHAVAKAAGTRWGTFFAIALPGAVALAVTSYAMGRLMARPFAMCIVPLGLILSFAVRKSRPTAGAANMIVERRLPGAPLPVRSGMLTPPAA